MKKLQKEVRELLHAAKKVENYRGDVTAPKDMEELAALVEKLEAVQREKEAPEASYRAVMDRLHVHLKKIGGMIYPKTFLSDNIEVILVAAIVVIGIRSFFFQPFIIPTNSMYPTYSGMKEKLYAADELPNAAEKVVNFITKGARHQNLVATTSGELTFVKGRTQGGDWTPLYKVVEGENGLVCFRLSIKPTLFMWAKRHTLYVCRLKSKWTRF